MGDYRDALATAVSAAREAGALLREGLAHPGQARQYDLRAEELIRGRLRTFNGWGYLSDETGQLSGADGTHLWLVDPNDGTFHYNTGSRGSAVGIAALRNGVPILGVVYAFAFPDDRGDLLAWAEGCGPISRNARPVDQMLHDAPLDEPGLSFDHRLIVYLSPGADHFPNLAAGRVAPARYITVPSLAYRLALVAIGEGVGTLSLNSPCSYDYAAGHALLRAAGGVFVDQEGAAIHYTAEGLSTCDRCFAGGPRAAAALRGRPWTEPPNPGSTEMVLSRVGRFAPARRPPGAVLRDAGVLSRAQGCLLGQVAGDALGALVEFRDADEIQQRYPSGCRELIDGGTWHNLAGQPTDDSELALLLSRTIANAGRYDESAVLAAYVDWWNDPSTYDRGATIRQALTGAARAGTPEEAVALVRRHASPQSQSNGSLMRVSPVGVYAAGQPGLAAELARRDAALTHPHEVCVDGAGCFAAAIACAVGSGATAEETYSAAVAEARTPEVRRTLEAARSAKPVDYFRQQGWVMIALQNAFYHLLHTAGVEDGVVATVMAGGDTDTNAAIAGALLGAVHGRDGVPARWQRCIRSCRMFDGAPTRHPRGREYWPVDLLDLAECLLLAGQVAGA